MADQVTTPSGLTYEDIEAGTGATAQSGQKAKVHGTTPSSSLSGSSRLSKDVSRRATGPHQNTDQTTVACE